MMVVSDAWCRDAIVSEDAATEACIGDPAFVLAAENKDAACTVPARSSTRLFGDMAVLRFDRLHL